jgi:hypothetical protein
MPLGTLAQTLDDIVGGVRTERLMGMVPIRRHDGCLLANPRMQTYTQVLAAVRASSPPPFRGDGMIPAWVAASARNRRLRLRADHALRRDAKIPKNIAAGGQKCGFWCQCFLPVSVAVTCNIRAKNTIYGFRLGVKGRRRRRFPPVLTRVCHCHIVAVNSGCRRQLCQ